MAWAMSANLRRELEAGSSAPVLAVRLGLPILRWLEVLDWTQGAGESVSITANGNNRQITEGADFVASGSNATTAREIANAWNADASRISLTGTRAVHRSGNRVAFVGLNPGIATMTIGTSHAPAWADNFNPNPTTLELCSTTGALAPALHNYWPILSHASGIEWSLDPVNRKTTPPLVDLVFSGGREMRELQEYYGMFRFPVDLYLGTDGLDDFADYMRLPRLFVADLIPGAGLVTLKLVDAAGDAWRDRKVGGAWVGWHPLQIVHDILLKAGAVEGVNFLAASLQYDTADPSRSHFCLSRYWDEVFGLKNSIAEKRTAGELVDQLLALMSGTWRPTQEGPYEFLRFDYTAASVRQWEAGEQTGHDVDDVDQESAFQNLINAMVVSFARGEQGKFHEYTETDLISFLESNSFLSDAQHRTDWLNGIAEMGFDPERFDHAGGPVFATGDAIIQDDTIEFPVKYASRQGFCGTQRVDGSPSTLAPGMSMGAASGRYAVLKPAPTDLAQRSDGLNLSEYILVDDWVLVDDLPDGNHVQTGPDDPIVSSARIVMHPDAYNAHITDDPANTLLPNGLTIGEFFGAGSQPGFRTGRGCLSPTEATTPGFWAGRFSVLIDEVLEPQTYTLQLVDYTIPVYMAKEVVRRFRFGAPTIGHWTSLLHADIELGEFVTLQGDEKVMTRLRGHGADSNVIWEVTGKHISIFGDQAGVEWELTYVRDDALLATPIYTPALPPPVVVTIGTQPQAEASVFYFEDPTTGMRIDVGVEGGGVYTVG